MIFATKNAIEDILSGKKTQTRRLVKEGDCADFNFTKNIVRVGKKDYTKPPNEYEDEPFRTKWQVGRDYAVQSGRGKAGLWYCPKCKGTVLKTGSDPDLRDYYFNEKRRQREMAERGGMSKRHCALCEHSMNSLRIVLTSIRKEKLLDVSEEDAKKEGFKTKGNFVKAFQTINLQAIKKKKIKYLGDWNPEVWVLDFSVVKQ